MFQQLSLNISFPRAKNIGANSDTHCLLSLDQDG